ncbi:glutathione S-transferase family protein [Sulfitobacter mediterraneus]|uniref:glutathione S-transferase family protein n=1 Tax=Sulfitobacter mediterraneus TaxID=83219 RepID=UPI001939D3AF|nr:glutathione S-transferase family protein [Sulfitobacter mediterraneus]MBM1555240.1 glutathione S-transferase family protein [Sulfitobacter mediterraneus]MBM1567207.1 glutathione S-transferase family protein [Sulfitobacter mediterraneus]MBM1571009.1 glutathione S-transferase family protein [Sulfitobacter mediterraneus]MBM1574809.1 glutathione S-transferase family protein [Sulfitobacter mediterraneus]MBM1578198.1 glutathione S-transferase family protein [Sulfitobacter mediterraneus]
MITLYTYKPAFGEPAASPFCTKAIWLLNMSGQDWQREDLADPRKMPNQKLPAIQTDGQLIHDSDNIRSHLEGLGAEFDPGLSDMEKATSRAFIRMAEEHMYFHIVADRWCNDAVWPVIRETYFDSIPKLLRKLITNKLRKSVIQGTQFQGLGRWSDEERLARLEPDLQAILTRLWLGAYLFGDRPTAADASVAAMLTNMRATPGKTLLKTRVAEDEVLCRYIDRVSDALGKQWVTDGSASLCA